jgi:hypothetical protein
VEHRYFDDWNESRSYYVVAVPVDKYYLFYDFGEHSFHTPIEECDLEKYPDLEKIRIENLYTHGEDILDLISVQFVDKILSLIASKNYQYVN